MRFRLKRSFIAFLFIAGALLPSPAWAVLTVAWSDDPLTTNHKIRKTHIDEIIANIRGLYAAKGCAGAPTFSGDLAWVGGSTSITPGTTPVRAVHINDLRAGVNDLFNLLGMPNCPSIALPAPAAGTTLIRTGYISELRQCINTLDAAPQTCGAPVCGNGGAPQAGEQCDDGNTDNGDGCSSTCQIEPANTCGNPAGVVDPGEECDPPGSVVNAGLCQTCDAICNIQENPPCCKNQGQACAADGECCSNFCNGGTGLCEDCKPDGMACTGNGECCTASCEGGVCGTLCGNGTDTDPGEECDDGNTLSGDGCDAFCKVEPILCGNSQVDASAGEDCDPPGSVVNAGLCQTCDNYCHTQENPPCCVAQGQPCPGGNSDCCSNLCVAGTCADCKPNGMACAGSAECCSNSCNSGTCGNPCGNGVYPEPGEECDDGNNTNGDGCDSGCNREPICGNGPPIEAGEGCDDGNLINGDGCSSTCVIEPGLGCCGDGVWGAGEECEFPPVKACTGIAPTPNANCDSTCKIPIRCGNGIREGSEQCDNDVSVPPAAPLLNPPSDCCNSVCQTDTGPLCGGPRCGNGTIDQTWEKCDNDIVPAGNQPAYNPPSDCCTQTCQLGNDPACSPGCGNGVIEALEQCDDGNQIGGDGCAGDCTSEAPTMGGGCTICGIITGCSATDPDPSAGANCCAGTSRQYVQAGSNQCGCQDGVNCGTGGCSACTGGPFSSCAPVNGPGCTSTALPACTSNCSGGGNNVGSCRGANGCPGTYSCACNCTTSPTCSGQLCTADTGSCSSCNTDSNCSISCGAGFVAHVVGTSWECVPAGSTCGNQYGCG